MIAIGVWAAAVTVIGWAVLSCIPASYRDLAMSEKLALSYLVGVGLVTLEMVAVSCLGMPFSRVSLGVPWLPVIIAGCSVAYFNRRRPDAGCGCAGAFSGWERFFIGAIVVQVCYTFFRALMKPIEAFDAVAIYGFKAKAFYLAHAIPADYLTRLKDIIPHPEYPLLVPLAETSFYTVAGSLNDLLVKAIFVFFYIAGIVIIYHGARHIAGRTVALAAAFFMATIPMISEYATNGYADLVFTIYGVVGILYLYRWIVEEKPFFLIISLAGLALSLWTKAEGFVFIGAACVMVGVYLSQRHPAAMVPAILYLCGSCILLMIAVVAKAALGLGIQSDFSLDVLASPSYPAHALASLKAILYEYQRQFFGPKKWNIIWILFLLVLAGNVLRAFTKKVRWMTIAVVTILGAYTFIYTLSKDLSWHLDTSASRLFIHIAPLAILWLCVIAKERQWQL